MDRTGGKLTHVMVSQVKVEIAAGGLQKEVGDKLRISQATVSKIKSGQRYGEVPWPNGRCGSFDQAYKEAPGQVMARALWSPLTHEYMQWPEYYQMRMLEAVNKKREGRGMVPIPLVSVEWEIYMAAPIGTPEEVNRRERIAQASEDRRRGLIMKEFNLIREAIAHEKSTREFQEMLADWRKQNTIPTVTSKPEFTFALSEIDVIAWEDVDVNHPERAKALRERDPWRMAAICVLFRQIKREHWGRKFISREVDRIRLWVAADPVAAEYAEKEYGKYVPATEVDRLPAIQDGSDELHRE